MDPLHNWQAHCVRPMRENYGSPRRGAPCNRDQERSNCPAACSDGSRQTPQARDSAKQCRGTPGAAKQETFPASPHLEFPGTVSQNPWLEAFAWIRQNTPPDSYFALDPYYMERPGEDFHSFRALAERSALANYVKDPSVATQVPRLAPRWLEEVTAQEEWRHFQAADFQRLKNRFGVDWVVLEGNAAPGMDCPYHNELLRVCRIE